MMEHSWQPVSVTRRLQTLPKLGELIKVGAETYEIVRIQLPEDYTREGLGFTAASMRTMGVLADGLLQRHPVVKPELLPVSFGLRDGWLVARRSYDQERPKRKE